MRFILIFFLGFSITSFAQVFSFKTFVENEGVSQTYVYKINQDYKGFLYLGTGKGLFTFGGKKFKNLSTEDGLSSNFITTIYKDDDKSMWLGHYEGGVSQILPSGEIIKIDTKGKAVATITQILKISPDVYLFLKRNNGLSTYNKKSKKFEDLNNETFSEILDIQLEGDKCLFLKQNSLEEISVSDFLSKKYDTKLKIKFKDACLARFNISRNLLLISDNYYGLLVYNNNTNFTPVDTFKINKSATSEYTDIISDNNNNIYISTSENGYFKLNIDSRVFKNYTTKNGLKSNAIQSLFVDRENNLWVGFYGKGVQLLSNELYSYYLLKDENELELSINSIAIINNRILLATNKGLGYLENNKISFVKSNQLKANIKSLLVINDHIYFSTLDGQLFKTDSLFRKIERINYQNSKEEMYLNTMVKKDNSLFICTTSGLFIYNTKTNSTELLNNDNGLLHNNIKYAFSDSKERLWICSAGSVLYYLDKNKNLKRFDSIPNLKEFNINSICEDDLNNIWISTIGDGVFQFNGKKFTNYNLFDGLFSRYCYGIVGDRNNGIWVTHNNGLSYKNANKKNFNHIGEQNELIPNNFIENAITNNKVNNSIYFGTTSGLVLINASKQKYNYVEPKLNILSISLNGKSINPNLKDTILPYGSYDLTFNFIGTCLTETEKVQYKFMLEGLQDKFIYSAFDVDKSEYHKLQDGEYKFILYAANNDDLWNNKPLEVKFIIDKPFWKKPWLYLFGFIFLSIVIYIIIKARTKILIQQKLELESVIIEKTDEIRREKEIIEELFKDLEHRNKDIRDSINYAERIQRSLLASKQLLSSNLKEYFVFFQPKDVVSGDFYWATKLKNDNFVLVTADSTGHGVPGAIMSILNIACLKEAVTKGIESPDLILNETRDLIIENLKNDGTEEGGKDGMDCSLLSFDFKNGKLYCALANNPVWIIRDNTIIEIKYDAMAIGRGERDDEPFTLKTIEIFKDDVIYTVTDGFQDQFGGPRGRKFLSRPLKELLLSIHMIPMELQRNKLNEIFDAWKGDLDQIDDVCIVGIRV
ncbi:MAG: two-component regulator propeller domain-containing protein [Bacteroidota bacterium]|nr:two-component regulator propeller domain-containing protein [Bacteroidota bacterium]MDP3145705.1 two-component regulator propeller domain-containing protein [Bacteroidota bacterium]